MHKASSNHPNLPHPHALSHENRLPRTGLKFFSGVRFRAFTFLADALLPLVEIEQQAHWTPDEDKPGGWAAKGLMYAKIILGWALSLLAVAGFSGLVKSE